MARQQDACWQCATPWSDDGPPATPSTRRTRLRARDSADPVRARQRASREHSGIAAAATGDARAVAQARLDMDRWVDEGGRVPFEAAALLRTTTRR
jgi:hypothetical protein